MINTYNLQFGLQTLLGDVTNQLAMFICMLLFVRPSTGDEVHEIDFHEGNTDTMGETSNIY